MYEKGGLGSDPDLLRIEAARLFLTYLGVDSGGAVYRLGVIFFGGEAQLVAPPTSLSDDSRRAELARLIADPPRPSWTNPQAALDLAEATFTGLAGRRAVVLLTDGKPELSSNPTPQETAEAISRLQATAARLAAAEIPLFIILLQNQATDADPEIDPIRVELLSTEMPIHQIAKGGDEQIRIMRRKSSGQVELQWRIDYNRAVGRPGQLAYRLDTWVIKRRLSELPRPLPRLVRIGDLRQIARELKHGADTAAVRRAFDQNAATFIRARVRYRTKSGEDEALEGYFNRYNVFYRGHAMPGGRRAEG